jgi:hydroxymethylglutaryl-CoA reductase
MGANFINSVLESFAQTMVAFFEAQEIFNDDEKDVEVLMSILSNYTPECLVRAEVECPIQDLGDFQGGMDAKTFARRFCKAVKVAKVDSFRATTHNKGIFNGIDAVVIATANDFRAVEACGHSYAARNGKYQGLSDCDTRDGVFRFWLEVPLCIGTVGGLTSLHPIAKRSLELLENPSAVELMQVIAATGLAQNFAAVRSLVTTGIQKGHMKMHLQNILNHVEANEEEKDKALSHFEDKVISFKEVRDFVYGLRDKKPVS